MKESSDISPREKRFACVRDQNIVIMNIIESIDEIVINMPKEPQLKRLRSQLDNFFISLSCEPLLKISITLHEALLLSGTECASLLESLGLENVAISFLVNYAGQENELGELILNQDLSVCEFFIRECYRRKFWARFEETTKLNKKLADSVQKWEQPGGRTKEEKKRAIM